VSFPVVEYNICSIKSSVIVHIELTLEMSSFNIVLASGGGPHGKILPLVFWDEIGTDENQVLLGQANCF
jgi:hypothetical protein